MHLSDFYPPPTKLIQSELTALKYLMTNTYITQEQSTFAQHAQMYYSRNKNYRHGFEFFSYFDVCHAEMPAKRGRNAREKNHKPNLRLVVAALIELKKDESYSNVSYCLAVCRIRAKHPAIWRKFHFDVTVTSGNEQARRQQHPTCHLQYCGEMIPGMIEMGCREEQLKSMHASLSEPRVFFWPMSLALLVDMALHEFPDPYSLRFRESSEWRGIVRNHEALVLRPFYEICIQIMRNTPGNERILADEFYVE